MQIKVVWRQWLLGRLYKSNKVKKRNDEGAVKKKDCQTVVSIRIASGKQYSSYSTRSIQHKIHISKLFDITQCHYNIIHHDHLQQSHNQRKLRQKNNTWQRITGHSRENTEKMNLLTESDMNCTVHSSKLHRSSHVSRGFAKLRQQTHAWRTPLQRTQVTATIFTQLRQRILKTATDYSKVMRGQQCMKFRIPVQCWIPNIFVRSNIRWIVQTAAVNITVTSCGNRPLHGTL